MVNSRLSSQGLTGVPIETLPFGLCPNKEKKRKMNRKKLEEFAMSLLLAFYSIRICMLLKSIGRFIM